MRPLLLCASLLACAAAPRRWARDRPAAPAALPPLAAERVAPDEAAPAPEEGAFLSADGRSRTRPGPCAPEATPAGDEAVVACTHTPERGWREWRYPGPGALLDVHEGVALIARASAHGDLDVVRFDIDLARAATVTLPEPTARWRRAGFTRSGMLVGLVRTGTAARPGSAWVRGRADGALAMEPLPLDADDLAVDGELALCVGPAGAAVQSALGWSRGVTLPAGMPAVATAAGVRRAGERVRCADGRCVIDGAARVVLRPGGGGADPAGVSGRDIH